jgi:hypothetical protein
LKKMKKKNNRNEKHRKEHVYTHVDKKKTSRKCSEQLRERGGQGRPCVYEMHKVVLLKSLQVLGLEREM